MLIAMTGRTGETLHNKRVWRFAPLGAEDINFFIVTCVLPKITHFTLHSPFDTVAIEIATAGAA